MSWLQLLKYLPEIISLIKAIQQRIDQDKVDRKVSDDLKALKAAFDAGDIKHFNELFNKTI